MVVIMRDALSERMLYAFTIAVLLAVPVLILIVPHTGTELYVLAALAGMIAMMWPSVAIPRTFTSVEKIVCIGCGVFVFTVIVSVAASGLKYEAVRELDVLLRPILAIPLLYLLIRTRPSEGILWIGMSLGAILAGLNAIYEVLGTGHSARAQGVTGAITYGNTALVMGFIAAIGIPYFRRLGSVYIFIPIAALLLGLLGSFLSGTRGGWIALPVLTLLLIWNHWRPTYRYVAVACGLTLIITASLAFVVPHTNVHKRIDAGISEVTQYLENRERYGGSSIGKRFEMWRAAWDLFAENPIFGGGMGNAFRNYLQEGIAVDEYHPATAGETMPHNVFMNVLATRGLVGLAGLLALWLTLMYAFWAASKDLTIRIHALGIAGLTLLIFYIISGLTHSVMNYGRPLTFFCLYSILIVYLISESRTGNTHSTENRKPTE